MRKIPLLIVSTVISAGLLVGCGTDQTSGSTGKNTNPVTEEVNVKEVLKGHVQYEEMENGMVKITYSAENTSSKDIDITFPSGMKVDYILSDKEGSVIEQYSKNNMATMAIEEVKLDSKQGFVEEFVLEGLPNGTYSIELFLNEAEQKAKTSLEFDIKTSIYQKGVGTLTGQIDSHSVEIVMEGNPKAFQLTDEAKEQLQSIEEKSEVKFVFTDTGIEMATIERFIN